MANRRRGPISNRRHLARQQREALQSRRIMFASIAIIGIVLALVVYGLLVSRVIEPQQPVASVDGEEILTEEFRARATYERLLLVSQWNSLADLMISFGATDANSAAFFVNQMNQIEFQLDPTTVGRSVLNDLIADRLIRAEAAARGIVVTKEEVDTAVEEFFSYYESGSAPTPTPAPTMAPTSTLTPLQMTLTAPTPTPTLTITETEVVTDTAIITPTNPITDTAVVTGTGEDAPEIEATPEITITATPRPTATPYSYDDFVEAYEGYTGTIADLGVSEEAFRYLIESQLYREKIKDVITADVQPTQDQVWARHILVPTEEEALDVIARLDAGELFATLAAELSTDTGSAVNGGDLGWFGVGMMVPDFEKRAFNLAIGEISEPVQSQFGWHVIQALGHEFRSLSADEFRQLQDSVFEEWLTSQRLKSEVELFDIWADRVPLEPSVPAGGAQALLQQLQVPLP